MRGLTRDTAVEMFDRKIVYVFLVLTVLAILFFLAIGTIQLQISTSNQGAADQLAQQANQERAILINGMFGAYVTFLILLAVLASAALFPRMLERGRADFYLAQPLSRTSFYLYKFVGIFVSYGGLIGLSSIIVYIAVAVATRGYDVRFLVFTLIGAAVSMFIWLSIVTCVGIVARTQTLAIAAAFVIWFLQLALRNREAMSAIIKSKAVIAILDIFYYILPKTSEVADTFSNLGAGKDVPTWMPVYSSLIFAVVVTYLTVLVFKKKSY